MLQITDGTIWEARPSQLYKENWFKEIKPHLASGPAGMRIESCSEACFDLLRDLSDR
jgi:hypothetical protein